MKVLILANFGMGLYKFRKELILELINQGYEVYVSFPKDEYSEKISNLGCKYIDVVLDRRGMNPIKDLKLLSKYRKMIREINPDIVLTYTIKPNIYGGLACQLEKVPYITNITGLGTSIEEANFISKIINAMYKFGVRKSNHVFFQNNSNFKHFKINNILNSDYTVLSGSGVNLEEFIQVSMKKDKKINLLYIGRIMKNKGINELIEVAKDLVPKNKYLTISIVGFDEESYEKELITLNNKDIIKYYGKQNDVIPFIEKSTAVIQPSYHEGLSNVLLEAAAMGRPLLASNIPGCKEIIDHGINGYLFEPKSVESIKETVGKFVSLSYEDRKQMGIKSRIKVENEFDRNIVVNEYINRIKEIIGEANERFSN